MATNPVQSQLLWQSVAEDESDDWEEDDEEEGDPYMEQWQQASNLAKDVIDRNKVNMRAVDADSKEILVKREQISAIACTVTFLLLVSIPLSIHLVQSTQKPWLFGIIGLCYLLYLCESLVVSKTSSYLTNVCSEEAFAEYIAAVQESDPMVKFEIQNYHYEIRFHTDSKGRTHRRRKRVNTHSAEMNYDIAGHTDETLSPQQFVAMFHLLNGHGNLQRGPGGDISFVVEKTGEQVMLLLCHFPLDFHPRSHEAGARHDQTRDNFWRMNTTDKYQDKKIHQKVKFRGYVEHMMVVLSSAGSDVTTRPWWMQYWVFAVATIFLMSIPYRFFFFSRTHAKRWGVTKHFTHNHPSTWQGDPVHSLKASANAHLATVLAAGPNLHIRKAGREESAEPGGDADEYEKFHVHYLTGSPVQVGYDIPPYWTNKNMGISFDTKETISPQFQAQLQKLLDDTFKKTATRDRKDPMPKRLKLFNACRVEDLNMWMRYVRKRGEIAATRQIFTKLTDLEGSGDAKTMPALGGQFRTRLVEDMNEFYLFHGTSPAGALGIREGGFRLSFAGSNAGTMFGRGAYFAEASSKCDEYAQTDDSGMYSGIYGALLCRVVMGEMFRITKSNIPAIERALESGEYDSVLGDREAAAGTYREFVVFDEAQIYPEYVILYTREY